jgi:hypothetical protein
MLWQRFLYDNLNLPDSWIFRPRITRITLNLSQFFRVNSRVSWAALPNKKQNSTPHLAPRSIRGRFALPHSLGKRERFYLDPCRRILSPHSSSASQRQSSTRLSNVSIWLKPLHLVPQSPRFFVGRVGASVSVETSRPGTRKRVRVFPPV